MLHATMLTTIATTAALGASAPSTVQAARRARKAPTSSTCRVARSAPRGGIPAVTDNCIPCSAGSATGRVLGAASCTACDGGKRSESLSVYCTNCESGTAAPTRSANCTKCPVGFYAHIEGLFSCIACAAGRASGASEGQTSCSQCEQGYAQSEPGQQSCNRCARGSFASSTGSLACRFCAEADSRTLRGRSCADCEAGRGDLLGQASCGDCEAGRAQASKGSTTCRECAAGRYQPSGGVRLVSRAKPEKPEAGLGRPRAHFVAPASTAMLKRAAAVRVHEVVQSRVELLLYVHGGLLLGRSNRHVRSMFKRRCRMPRSGPKPQRSANQTRILRISPLAVDVQECPSGKKACMGGNASGFYCREGHGGPLCEICEHNYFRIRQTPASNATSIR